MLSESIEFRECERSGGLKVKGTKMRGNEKMWEEVGCI